MEERPIIRRTRFVEMCAPFTAHFVARVLNTLTPGVNWYKCTKGHIAIEFGQGNHGLSKYDVDDIRHAIKRLLEEEYEY